MIVFLGGESEYANIEAIGPNSNYTYVIEGTPTCIPSNPSFI
jgi:hypothetical protein